MNSIFFRIYAGILLMVLLIGALAYGSIKVADHYRANDYRQEMAHGTFYLIAQGLTRYPTADQRQQWLRLVSKLVGAKFGIASGNALSLSGSEKSQLKNGKVVLRLNDQINNAEIIFAVPNGDKYLHTRMAKISEKQARATAWLVLNALQYHPMAEWPDAIKQLQDEFGFPVYYEAFDKVQLDNEQTRRLQQHEVVLSINDSKSQTGSSVTVYAAIGNSGQVLVMGPMFLFDPYPIEMLSIIGIISLLLLALAAYFLVRPLQNRLGQLETVIKRMGDGDFTARADASRQDAVGQLAGTFNGMGEHIRRLIESQQEMTRAVSHELRTPVARLRFGLEILADYDEKGVMGERLEALDADIEELDTLIDEILTFAKLQEGMPSLELEKVDMPDLMRQICDEIYPISDKAGVRVEFDEEALKRVPIALRQADGERRYLHRILQNLVTNAIRYGDSQVRIRYFVEGNNACLEVDDNGEGIPEAERERIFEPFARLDKSRQKKSGGYGLGLSIVGRIMEWHGGYVDVSQSDDLGGARFRVVWPRLRHNGHVLG